MYGYKLSAMVCGALALILVLLWGVTDAGYAARDRDAIDTPQVLGSIAGRVTDGDGVALAGIEVLLYEGQYTGTPTQMQLSDADGRYRFATLSMGRSSPSRS